MRRRRKRSHNQTETNPFRFFKIILPSVFDHNMLRIPDKFAKKFPCHVSAVVTLTTPTGVAWKVVMSRNKGKLYFSEGWGKFMEHNLIRYGYFLEFEYLGNHQFSVHIFDLSCCEIDYPRSDNHDCPREDDDQNNQQHPNKESPVQVKQEAEEGATAEILSVGTMYGSKCEGSKAFTVVARNCHVDGHYLHIPKVFEKQHMRRDLGKCVMLQTKDGREWQVGCLISPTGWRMRGLGWKKFAEENKWQVGEMYTFNLVGEKCNSLVFQVINQ